MIKIVNLSFAVILLLVISCEHEQVLDVQQTDLPGYDFAFAQTLQFPEIAVTPQKSTIPLSGNEVARQIESVLKSGKNFSWEESDSYFLWSAVNQGEGYVSVGFNSLTNDPVTSNQAELLKARTYLIEFILRQESLRPDLATFKTLDVDFPESLPVLWIKVNKYETIDKLRKLSMVSYIEPIGYDFETYTDDSFTIGRTKSVGCIGSGGHDEDYSGDPDRYTTPFMPSYNSKVSWHLTAHRIPEAWQKSQGDNVLIGLLDTGIGKDQPLLHSPLFNAGLSSGRSISINYTFDGALGNQDDGNDRCGHGSTMAGQISGPVNNRGSITGVAYKADLISYRVANDVWINTVGNRKAYVKALEKLANNASVRVINSSVGRLVSHKDVKKACEYAEDKGKLMICAAGSVGNNIGVFPAKYSSTIGVTAVKYDPVGDPQGKNLKVAGENAIGDHVDFCVYLQRKSDGDWALGMHIDKSYVIQASGSSAATATVSGIAALIWSAKPSLTRAQVISILRQSASLYPNKSSDYGYGVIDARKAVDLAKSM